MKLVNKELTKEGAMNTEQLAFKSIIYKADEDWNTVFINVYIKCYEFFHQQLIMPISRSIE